jgi:hypothetical protein
MAVSLQWKSSPSNTVCTGRKEKLDIRLHNLVVHFHAEVQEDFDGSRGVGSLCP